MEPFVKITKVAQMTGVSLSTLRRWVSSGQGPQYKKSPGGILLFRISDVEKWIESLEGPPTPRPDAT
jgi:excisionase family DNA binding protein